jgi:hypothetical protein
MSVDIQKLIEVQQGKLSAIEIRLNELVEEVESAEDPVPLQEEINLLIQDVMSATEELEQLVSKL